jgi:hypothetical protein
MSYEDYMMDLEDDDFDDEEIRKEAREFFNKFLYQKEV